MSLCESRTLLKELYAVCAKGFITALAHDVFQCDTLESQVKDKPKAIKSRVQLSLKVKISKFPVSYVIRNVPLRSELPLRS